MVVSLDAREHADVPGGAFSRGFRSTTRGCPTSSRPCRREFVAGRRLQIDYLKRFAPDLARIPWQAYDTNLYRYPLLRFLAAAAEPARQEGAARSGGGSRRPERNWEVQFSGRGGAGASSARCWRPDRECTSSCRRPRVAVGCSTRSSRTPLEEGRGYTVSMLLTLRVVAGGLWLRRQPLRLLVVGSSWPPQTFLGRLMRGLAASGVECALAFVEEPDQDWFFRSGLQTFRTRSLGGSADPAAPPSGSPGWPGGAAALAPRPSGGSCASRRAEHPTATPPDAEPAPALRRRSLRRALLSLELRGDRLPPSLRTGHARSRELPRVRRSTSRPTIPAAGVAQACRRRSTGPRRFTASRARSSGRRSGSGSTSAQGPGHPSGNRPGVLQSRATSGEPRRCCGSSPSALSSGSRVTTYALQAIRHVVDRGIPVTSHARGRRARAPADALYDRRPGPPRARRAARPAAARGGPRPSCAQSDIFILPSLSRGVLQCGHRGDGLRASGRDDQLRGRARGRRPTASRASSSRAGPRGDGGRPSLRLARDPGLRADDGPGRRARVIRDFTVNATCASSWTCSRRCGQCRVA